jgi:hypothetical protein
MRYYGAEDIITLPTLGAAGAVALGQSLITAAKAESSLPALIASRLSALELAHTTLHRALTEQQQFVANPKRARQADLAEDQAWAAMHNWLLGWTKMPAAAADPARRMYAVLFPSRLQFTQLPYKLEWAEADARLARVSSEGFDSAIEQLGGSLILAQLRETHRAYGEALAITAESPAVATVGLREPLATFVAALRAYVLAVAAHADPAVHESLALTNSLLSPLLEWQSPRKESNAAPQQSVNDPPVLTTQAVTASK